MKVELQGTNECMLVTMAALAGRSLSETRTLACKAAGVSRWTDAFKAGQSFRYQDGVNAVRKAYRLTNLVPKFVPEPPKVWRLPKSGRGSISISHGSLFTFAHVAPYSNGLIYDPNDPTVGRTLRQWLRWLEHCGLKSVTIWSLTNSRRRSKLAS
jgi:hypothetical protein